MLDQFEIAFLALAAHNNTVMFEEMLAQNPDDEGLRTTFSDMKFQIGFPAILVHAMVDDEPRAWVEVIKHGFKIGIGHPVLQGHTITDRHEYTKVEAFDKLDFHAGFGPWDILLPLQVVESPHDEQADDDGD